MLIPNQPTFNLPISTTPSIRHGMLDPSVDYSDSDLLAAAVGSIYIQRITIPGADCTTKGTESCMWLKQENSVDCNALGQPTDWKPMCCQILSGTTPPIGMEDPWCNAPTCAYYLNTDTGDLYVKTADGCSNMDWTPLGSTETTVTVGTGCPDGAALSGQALGSYYIDTTYTGPAVYVKLYNNGDDDDWVDLTSSPTIWKGGAPDADGTDDEACAPIGSYWFDTLDNDKMYVKVKNGTAFDWVEMITTLTLSQNPSLTGLKTLTNVGREYTLNLSPVPAGRIGYEGADLPITDLAFLLIDTMVDLDYDTFSGTATPVIPVGLNDRVVAPVDGVYNIQGSVGFGAIVPTVDLKDVRAGLNFSFDGGSVVTRKFGAIATAGPETGVDHSRILSLDAGEYVQMHVYVEGTTSAEYHAAILSLTLLQEL